MEQIQWSFSSLKDFIGCPKRYQEVKVLKNYEFQPTAATTYGNKVHAALEAYVKDGAELPANYKQYQGYADGIIDIPGEKIVEYKMALLTLRVNPVSGVPKIDGCGGLLI